MIMTIKTVEKLNLFTQNLKEKVRADVILGDCQETLKTLSDNIMSSTPFLDRLSL